MLQYPGHKLVIYGLPLTLRCSHLDQELAGFGRWDLAYSKAYRLANFIDKNSFLCV
jgi:hypothetical protein